MNKELDVYTEHVGKEIVDIAFHLHKALGPDLLESVYEKCFCHELKKRDRDFVVQKRVPIIYDNITMEEGLKLDLLVEDIIIIELKAQESYNAVWEAQLLSYLKLTDKRLGYIINFTVPLIKDGIKRMVL